MSWTLFVIAHPSEAHALVRAKPDEPPWSWTWISQNTATLGVLNAVLHGEDADADDAIASIEWTSLAEEEGGEGPWVYALPERFVSPLMTADPVWLAEAWARASFMRSYQEADLHAFIHELRALLREAERRQCELLYWEMQ